MRKLMTVVAILALCASFALAQGAGTIQANTNYTDGDAATATLDVGLSVAKYAEVTWNNPTADYASDWEAATVDSPAIALTGPVGRVDGVNYDEIPIRLRSNCDVTLTLAEGISQALIDAGVPQAAIYDPVNGTWGEHVYEVINTMGDPHQTFGSSVYGQEIMGNNHGGDAAGVYEGNHFASLPDSGTGLTSSRTFTYGGAILETDGSTLETPELLYEGDFETHIKIGVSTSDNVVQDGEGADWTWTDLEAGTEIANAKYYATVSVNN